ncbi:small CPxCG-related zinc finger protein [Natronomonas moolapensis 8.8.11]|uniref:Small CPxCG-related zinc finger protein n=1 Tax=Natronomonas moolapensis (strain DSM 18674 / CECT 7526 / JCM 14361 / 8.8.11) TaxID=268739 RepID=M1XN08_NATM8|nr:hypothetical protein [Natronomonas moolapensis]CCQ35287.1 small CPxCG-related zinc finger protein [Natronomonas moolapensis 8.8.11]
MAEDAFYCETCNEDVTHDDIETVTDVPEVDLDQFLFVEGSAEVYKCGVCGEVLGFNPA